MAPCGRSPFYPRGASDARVIAIIACLCVWVCVYVCVCMCIILYNCLQFLFIIKAAVLKQQSFICKFNARKLAITFISVSVCHKCKSYLLCLEFADKILIFAVLNRRYYNEDKLKTVFVFLIIFFVLLGEIGKVFSVCI